MTEKVELMHMFFLDDCDYVVDTDIDAAWAAYSKMTGIIRDNAADSVEIADDTLLTVIVDDAGKPSDSGNNKFTKTAGEWAQKLGRGLAFSTEY